MTKDINEIVLDAFRIEHREQLEQIRTLLGELQSGDDVGRDARLEEAFRLAHSFKGGARVCDLGEAERLGHGLETVLEQLSRGALPLTKNVSATITLLLDSIEDWMAALDQQQPLPDTTAALVAVDRVLVSKRQGSAPDGTHADEDAIAADETKKPCEAIPLATSLPEESVRVSVNSLDQLMHSTAQMLADNGRLTQFTRQLSEFQRDIDDLEREREAIHYVAAASLHKLAGMPEFKRITQYLENVDRQVVGLFRQSRRLLVEHRRAAWLLQRSSAQVRGGVHEARMVPASSVFQGFRKLVRDQAKAEGKEIEFRVSGLDVRADRMVLQELKDPLMHVLRNCVTHGIEMPERRIANGKPAIGHVSLSLEVVGGKLSILVADDGGGIDTEQVRQQAVRRGLLTEPSAAQQSTDDVLSLVFKPGFSTLDSATALAGRGMGLSIVHTAMTRMQGHVRIEPGIESGIRVRLSVPVFVSTHRVLLVTCGNQTIAIPSRRIERLLQIPVEKIETLEGRPIVTYQRRPVRLTSLSAALGLPESAESIDGGKTRCVVLLKVNAGLMAITVDALLEDRDGLIVNLDEFAETRLFSGGILLEDGRVALVLEPGDLSAHAPSIAVPCAPATRAANTEAGPPKVLIVDDSFTTRTLEKSILEAQGYQVCMAVDGVEALVQLRQQKFGAVISDIEMPRMNGLTLLKEIKADRRLMSTPVILVTSRDKQEDQQLGLELGAEAYIVKRKFDHQDLLNTIRQVL